MIWFGFNKEGEEDERRGGLVDIQDTDHCDPEPDSEKLKCLHDFYTDKYDSNAKNCHYY